MVKTELDHLVVAGQTLAQAAHHSEAALGLDLQSGGKHALFGTHNRLLGFQDRSYFEAIAIDPNAVCTRPRWFGLDAFSGPPRLLTWVARVNDLDAALNLWPDAGEIVDLERGDLRWRMAVPVDGALHLNGALPMLIQWQGDLHPSDQLGERGGAFVRLSIQTPNAASVSEMLEKLGLHDPRVVVEKSPTTRLSAQIDTPQGPKVLT